MIPVWNLSGSLLGGFMQGTVAVTPDDLAEYERNFADVPIWRYTWRIRVGPLAGVRLIQFNKSTTTGYYKAIVGKKPHLQLETGFSLDVEEMPLSNYCSNVNVTRCNEDYPECITVRYRQKLQPWKDYWRCRAAAPVRWPSDSSAYQYYEGNRNVYARFLSDDATDIGLDTTQSPLYCFGLDYLFGLTLMYCAFFVAEFSTAAYNAAVMKFDFRSTKQYKKSMDQASPELSMAQLEESYELELSDTASHIRLNGGICTPRWIFFDDSQVIPC